MKKTKMNQSKWALLVKERDGFKCRVCGSSERLNAHHIVGKTEKPDLQFEINNGITLCRDCHRTAHKGVYGKGSPMTDLHLLTEDRIKQVDEVINRAINEAMERDNMKEKIFLIFKDSMDDACEIKGAIVGTEEKADEWCEKYNKKCKYEWQEVYYVELKILTDDDIDE